MLTSAAANATGGVTAMPGSMNQWTDARCFSAHLVSFLRAASQLMGLESAGCDCENER